MTVLITTYERCYKVLAETSLKWKTLAQGRWPTDHFCDMSADRKITQLTSWHYQFTVLISCLLFYTCIYYLFLAVIAAPLLTMSPIAWLTFLLCPWTLTHDLNLQAWPRYSHGELACHTCRSAVVLFKSYCPGMKTGIRTHKSGSTWTIKVVSKIILVLVSHRVVSSTHWHLVQRDWSVTRRRTRGSQCCDTRVSAISLHWISVTSFTCTTGTQKL